MHKKMKSLYYSIHQNIIKFQFTSDNQDLMRTKLIIKIQDNSVLFSQSLHSKASSCLSSAALGVGWSTVRIAAAGYTLFFHSLSHIWAILAADFQILWLQMLKTAKSSSLWKHLLFFISCSFSSLTRYIWNKVMHSWKVSVDSFDGELTRT